MNIESLSEKQQRQVRAELATTWHVGVRQADPPEIPGYSDQPDKAKTRIRQAKEPKLNKLEAEALEWLRATLSGYSVQPHALRLRLANGVVYTPDVIANPICLPTARLRAYEIKGPHAWDDSIVKLKVAAGTWPTIQFTLVWKQDGQWQEQIVLP